MKGREIVDRARDLVDDNLKTLTTKLLRNNLVYLSTYLLLGIGSMFGPVYVTLMKIYMSEICVKGNKNFKFEHLWRQIGNIFKMNILTAIELFALFILYITGIVLVFVLRGYFIGYILIIGAIALTIVYLFSTEYRNRKIQPYVFYDFGEVLTYREVREASKLFLKVHREEYKEVRRCMLKERLISILTLGIYYIWYAPLSYTVHGIFYDEVKKDMLANSDDPIVEKMRKYLRDKETDKSEDEDIKDKTL